MPKISYIYKLTCYSQTHLSMKQKVLENIVGKGENVLNFPIYP